MAQINLLNKVKEKAKKAARIGVWGLAGIVGMASNQGCGWNDSYNPQPRTEAIKSEDVGLPAGIYTGTCSIDFNRNGIPERREIQDLGKLYVRAGEELYVWGSFGGEKGFAKLLITRNDGRILQSSLKLLDSETRCVEIILQPEYIPAKEDLRVFLFKNGAQIDYTEITLNP